MPGKITAVLEVGTSKVRCLVGEVLRDESVTVLAVAEVESRGIRKGEMLNRDEALLAVRDVLKETEVHYRKQIHSVVLVLSGGDTTIRTSHGELRLADPYDNQPQEVDQTDVQEVVSVAKKFVLSDERIRLHCLPCYYSVDDIQRVISPVGMSCERLRAHLLTIHGRRSVVENMQKLVSDVPVQCDDAVYSGLGAALAVTNKKMREAGVLVIDLGGGTTDFLLYYEGILRAGGTLRVGGDHITNDIAAGLQISIDQAERIKIKEGNALTNAIERDRTLSIPSDAKGFNSKMVRALTLHTIIQVRLEEIFEWVKDEVEKQSPNILLGSGVLLTGGGSFLNGARDLGQKVFNLPCSYGKPIEVHGLPSKQQSPYYASMLGAIRYIDSLEQQADTTTQWQRLLKKIWGHIDG